MPDPTGLPTVVIGMAGHIDHGKTSLLRALTGIDADRLPEEQARGMTIDVGYAHLAFDDGVELDFVDVPGHDRLIGNMLVGAGEIDAALLVVAADDGPRQQTLEHLRLLDALGIADGLAVVTKIDMVEPGRMSEVVSEVTELLVGTTVVGVPVLAASSATGAGIDEVWAALRGLCDRVAARPVRGGPLRLAIDRAFTVKGRGTVVTGSLRGGALERGAALRREPGGNPVRVREIQVHNHPLDRHEGGRTALNIAGLPVEALRRGDILTTGPGVVATDRPLVDLLRHSSGTPAGSKVPRSGTRLRLHLGTDQIDATVRLVPARPGTMLLALDRETATFLGDRGVLREPASGTIVGGVRVLDPAPPKGVSRRRLTAERLEVLALAVAATGNSAQNPAVIENARVDLHGAVMGIAAVTGPAVTGAALLLAPDVRDALVAAALELVGAHHREAPASAGVPLPRARAALLRRLRSLATVERRDAAAAQAAVADVLDALVAQGRVARQGEVLRDPARGSDLPADLVAAMARLEALLAAAAPPPLDEAAIAAGCPAEGVRALQADGRIVRLGPDLAWATPTYHRLAALALERARVAPLTPAAFRDATGTSRTFVLAILEDLDRRGILARTPGGHVPGPRAPRAEPAP